METDYRRVLVAVDLSPASRALVAAARAIAPGALLEVVHVLDTAGELLLRELDASPAALQAHRSRRAHAAREALEALLPPARAGCSSAVEFGRTAERICRRAQAFGADLLVLGRSPRGLLARLLARLLAGGGTAQAVLAGTRCDVLLLPVRVQASVSSASRSPAHRPPARRGHSARAS